MSGFRGRSRRPAAGETPTELDGLLLDMRELRLTLAADLHAAAAAAEDGAAQVASDIVEADRAELVRFGRMAEMRMARLHGLTSGEGAEDAESTATAGSGPSRWRRRVVVALPAVPLVGAMAVSAAAVTGALPIPGSDAPATTPQSPTVEAAPSSPVTSSFQQLVSVVDRHGASARDVIAAARALHRQIAALIAATSHDPAQAAQVAELLRMEQSLLLQAQPPGASVVLDATRRLAEKLVDTVPAVPKPTPTDAKLPRPLPSPSRTATKTSPTATPKQTTAPKPTKSASSNPDATQSPGPGHIPAVP